MKIYRPELPPLAPPIIWGKERYIVPPSKNTWNDAEVRRGMEFSLRSSADTVLEITKFLIDSELSPVTSLAGDAIVSAPLAIPYTMPPSVYVASEVNEEAVNNNNFLKDFATKAYDALDESFGTNPWDGWFIAPFFGIDDDTQETFQLGLFIDEGFRQTVVE